MRNRILFVDQSGQPGGAELCLADLAAAVGENASVLLLSEGPFRSMLEQRGIKTSVLPMPASIAGSGKQGGQIWKSPLDTLRYVPALRAQFHPADLLYFNTAKALVLGMAACWGKKLPTVFHLHDFLDPRHFSKNNLRMLAALSRRVDLVIANSHATAEACRQAGGTTKITVIPNGFDPKLFDASSVQQVEAHGAQWNPDGRKILAVFGRLARWKGQDVLLRAAAGVPECHVWIVGDALFTADDRAYAAELLALARQPELQGRVTFAGHRNDVALWMQAADVVVHSSTAPEPFGRVIVEAMLCKRPVVAANAGGPREILCPDGVDAVDADRALGLLHEPGDVNSLRAAIEHLLRNPGAASAMAERAALSARNRFDIRRVIGQTQDALSLILTR
jgi:glycosyltransferase involved in cell wall biosynthesis